MKTKSFIIAVIALCCALAGCDPQTPDYTKIVCSGYLYTDAESKTPISDAVVTPEVYTWNNSSYTGQIYESGWAVPISYGGNDWCEWAQKWCIFATDNNGKWGREITTHPTKLRLCVVYLDQDSVEHRFTTKEYDYKNNLSWQKIEIYASDYE